MNYVYVCGDAGHLWGVLGHKKLGQVPVHCPHVMVASIVEGGE